MIGQDEHGMISVSKVAQSPFHEELRCIRDILGIPKTRMARLLGHKIKTRNSGVYYFWEAGLRPIPQPVKMTALYVLELYVTNRLDLNDPIFTETRFLTPKDVASAKRVWQNMKRKYATQKTIADRP